MRKLNDWRLKISYSRNEELNLRQTNSQTDIRANEQTDIRTNGHWGKETHKHTDRQSIKYNNILLQEII